MSQETSWGRLYRVPDEQSPYPSYLAIVTRLPADRVLDLPSTVGQIAFAEIGNNAVLLFEQREAGPRLILPEKGLVKEPIAALEAPTASGQMATGVIFFLARHAAVKGPAAKFSSTQGDDRITGFTSTDDAATWNHTTTRPGTYDVWLTYAAAADTAIELSAGDKQSAVKLPATGAADRYRCLRIDTVKLPTSAKLTFTLAGAKGEGAMAASVKALMLGPACEGTPPVQAADGSITLHARDVVIRGVKVQWEPKPEKTTVGFWVNPKDQVMWRFKVTKPGTFNVEILQGCGKGSGGSNVDFIFFTNAGPQTLPVVVQDTGHFQNFVPRQIGTVKFEQPGEYLLHVIPRKKPGVAVMDLRQVTLTPGK